MASSSSDPYNQEVAIRKQRKSAPFKFLVPLVYAPVLPLIRLTLRHKPVLRDRLFFGVLVGAFVHGSYLVYLNNSISPETVMIHTLAGPVNWPGGCFGNHACTKSLFASID